MHCFDCILLFLDSVKQVLELIALCSLSSMFVPVDRYSASAVLVVFTAMFVTVIDAIRNVFFHPLSVFPGPRLAASSTWWSAYQQVIMGRSMHHICERLHEQYGRLPANFTVPKRLTKAGVGDIIRIGPNRVC